MRTIYKQTLEIKDQQIILLPQHFKILHIGVQNGVPTIWYECYTEQELVPLEIYCFGTGFNMDNLPKLEYIGTVQINGLVWHYYAKGEYRKVHYLFAGKKD